MVRLSRETREQRSRACHAIASLPKGASLDDVAEKLDPLVQEFLQTGVSAPPGRTSNVDDENDHVTPLMMACDRANSESIHYMEDKIKCKSRSRQLWGEPFASSGSLSGQNTAMHYAAASGFKVAIERLCAMCLIEMDMQSPEHQQAMLRVITDLFLQRNAHGDTPVMMACAEGQVEFLQHLMQLLNELMEAEKEPDDERQSRLNKVFIEVNDSGDSALVLACDHGRVAVVDYLLRGVGVLAKDQELEKCKETFDRLDSLIRNGAARNRDDIQSRHQHVKHCLALLRVAMERQSRKHMEELLQAETAEWEHKEQDKRAPKTPKKKRKKKSRLRQEIVNELIDEDPWHPSVDKSLNFRSKPEPPISGESTEPGQTDATTHTVSCASTAEELGKQGFNPDVLVPHEGNENTQSDSTTDTSKCKSEDGECSHGRAHEGVAVPNRRTTYAYVATQHASSDPNQKGVVSETICKISNLSGSLSTLLRETYKEPTVKQIVDSDASVDAMMDALCLDASMLLLSPHGMAMNLSPCQLEVVSAILQKQLENLKQAQEIQSRLRDRT